MPTLTQSVPSADQINALESVPLFTRIQIQTVSWCNRSCVFCPSGKFPVEKVFMPVEVYHRIMRSVAGAQLCRTYFALLDERIAPRQTSP